jgi:hypothetical protein
MTKGVGALLTSILLTAVLLAGGSAVWIRSTRR